jgi:hypothetical protein
MSSIHRQRQMNSLSSSCNIGRSEEYFVLVRQIRASFLIPASESASSGGFGNIFQIHSHTAVRIAQILHSPVECWNPPANVSEFSKNWGSRGPQVQKQPPIGHFPLFLQHYAKCAPEECPVLCSLGSAPNIKPRSRRREMKWLS